MAENLKKLFKKKKLDFKFRKAGPGRRLADDSTPADSGTGPSPAVRIEPTSEAKRAAEAALARNTRNTVSTGFSAARAKKSMHEDVKEEVRRELSSDRNRTSSPSHEAGPGASSSCDTKLKHLAATGVYFKCPFLGPEILSKSEWKIKIREYLYEQLKEEKGLASCLIIKNCNKPDKVEPCIETICRYLRNVINEPDEEKYRKIRISNRVFQEKVANMEGVFEYLEAAGFVKERLNLNGSEEDYLILSNESAKDVESLQVLIEAAQSAEVIGVELDRNVQVLLPAQADFRTELPDDFYRYSPEELKKEQQLRNEMVENSLVLRTKAMREKQELKEIKKYKYALIRVRFPDGILLQGTFGVGERMTVVHEFVAEHVLASAPFTLRELGGTGREFSAESADANKTLFELRLVPATVLVYHAPGVDPSLSYLKPDVTALLQNL